MSARTYSWFIGVILVAVLSTLALSACSKPATAPAAAPGAAAAPAAAAVKPIELTYSIFFPPTHIQCKEAEAWAKEIEKRTDGRVRSPSIRAVRSPRRPRFTKGVVGISDIGMSCLAYTRGRFPA